MSFFHLLDEVASPGAVSPEQFPWVAVGAAALVLAAAGILVSAACVALSSRGRKGKQP